MRKIGYDDVCAVLDKEIKKAIVNKNGYIELNGYAHKDVLQVHDARIATLSGLYYTFKKHMEQ